MKRLVKMQIVFAIITLILMALFIIFVVNPRRAISAEVEPQFENYQWGSSLEEVKEIVVSKGHHILTPDPASIVYSDRILDEKVNVYFFFTPKTKKLCTITLLWDTTQVSSSLLRVLTEKYGTPNKPDRFTEKYWWGGELLLKSESLETDLTYYSREYMIINMQEK